MAQFVYTYKTPDGRRHEGEISARSRDAVFAALRAQGIRAIKVEPRGWNTGEGYRGPRKRAVLALGLGCLVLGGALALLFYGVFSSDSTRPLPVSQPSAYSQSPQSFSLASPLPRQPILGDRVRIENPPAQLFAFALERHLARFAEPGRPLPTQDLPDVRILAGELRGCLNTPIRHASTEFTEYVDLKRIVAGMKRELRNYLDGGGTFADYCADLVKRQRMEIGYRVRAERRLADLLAAASARSSASAGGAASAGFSQAYDYWLKANAHLKSMGIFEMPLPERLRSYQLSVDLDVD